MSRASLMAGFEVTLHGRIWVTPEAYRKALPDMRRMFQFVDHSVGVILNRNLANLIKNAAESRGVPRSNSSFWIASKVLGATAVAVLIRIALPIMFTG
jgi:hypothetical protein